MTSFQLFAALLLLVTLACMVWPLLRRRVQAQKEERRAANLAIFRDQLAELEREQAEGSLSAEDFAQARSELQRRLLEEVEEQGAAQAEDTKPGRKTAVALVVLVPALAIAGYLTLGNPKALNPMATKSASSITPQQVEEMVAKLAVKMEANPDDPQGWIMLARSYKMLGRIDDAVAAYARAERVVETDPGLLADYADLLAVKNGGKLEGKPLQMVQQALMLDPDHLQALWMAGTAAFNSQDYANTIRYWDRALKQLEPSSEDAQMLTEALAEARNRMSVKSSPGKTIRGRVELAPALRSQASPDDTVFIFARPQDGSRMPIAVAKTTVAKLPYDFVLDDSSAMVAESRLSAQTQVIVLARVSKTGNAVAKPGDLESEAKPVKVGESKLKVVINAAR